MATYRLWLTIKDSSGKTKEIDGGTVNIDLTKLTDAEANTVAVALDLESYATDKELSDAVSNTNTIKYSDFKLKEEAESK
mgnify:CR=1 FL=1|jgi:hypothetical protein